MKDYEICVSNYKKVVLLLSITSSGLALPIFRKIVKKVSFAVSGEESHLSRSLNTILDILSWFILLSTFAAMVFITILSTGTLLKLGIIDNIENAYSFAKSKIGWLFLATAILSIIVIISEQKNILPEKIETVLRWIAPLPLASPFILLFYSYLFFMAFIFLPIIIPLYLGQKIIDISESSRSYISLTLKNSGAKNIYLSTMKGIPYLSFIAAVAASSIQYALDAGLLCTK